tara:strand:+ start:343 stop:537 length:195 start_codon:yes stop_codon:yes gene_type:complete
MYRLSSLRNFSTKSNTWCYRQGFYQYNINKKNFPISYGKWFTEAEKPINRITRQNKIKEFLDQR